MDALAAGHVRFLSDLQCDIAVADFCWNPRRVSNDGSLSVTERILDPRLWIKSEAELNLRTRRLFRQTGMVFVVVVVSLLASGNLLGG